VPFEFVPFEFVPFENFEAFVFAFSGIPRRLQD
jgi:hypothetical protein